MPIRRDEKWRIKRRIDYETGRLLALHPLEAELISKAYRSIDDTYAYVSEVLDRYGITAQTRALYRAYIQELWKALQTLSRRSLTLHATSIYVKYCLYGLDKDVAKEVADVMGVKVLSWGEIFEKLGMTEETIYKGTKRALDEELRQELVNLYVLATIRDYAIPAGETHYLPDKTTDPTLAKGVDVTVFKTKSVHIWGDYALEVTYEVSDDGTFEDHAPLKVKTLDVAEDYADWCHTEMGFRYIRVKVRNPDTVSHTVKRCSFKARGV